MRLLYFIDLSMIKQKLTIFCIGFAASLFGISNSAKAVSIGYSLSINNPVFSTSNGINNVPDFRLENISGLSEGVQITALTLTIGNTNYNYDFVRASSDLSDPGSDLEFTINTPDLENNTIGTDAIDYNFKGFDPGDIFQFEADVDKDGIPGTIENDYRNALFPNALLTVGFSNDTTLSQTLNPVDPSLNSYRFTQKVSLPETATILSSFLVLGLGAVMLRKRRHAVG